MQFQQGLFEGDRFQCVWWKVMTLRHRTAGESASGPWNPYFPGQELASSSFPLKVCRFCVKPLPSQRWVFAPGLASADYPDNIDVANPTAAEFLPCPPSRPFRLVLSGP